MVIFDHLKWQFKFNEWLFIRTLRFVESTVYRPTSPEHLTVGILIVTSISFAGVFPWFLTITTEVIFSPISSKLEAFVLVSKFSTKKCSKKIRFEIEKKTIFSKNYFETKPFWPFEEIQMANKWQEYKTDLFLLRFEVQIHKRSHQMKMELYLHLHTYYLNRSERIFLSKITVFMLILNFHRNREHCFWPYCT